MADNINDLRFLAALTSAGGLSATARALNASPAAMSRRLAAMEARLGVRLVQRTSRRFELTAEGALLHERSLPILAEIDAAEAEAASRGATPRGLLRVGAPSEIGRRRIAPLITGFTTRHPDVQVQLTLSDAGLDVIDDGLDLALRIGLPTDASVIATRLLASRRVVCAAPAYLARHGTPTTPADLLQHDCIRLVRGRRLFDSWAFRGGAIHVRGTLATTSGEVLHDWALAGYGIALKAHWDITADLEAGRLTSCLDEYACDPIELYAVYASRQHLAPKIRVFLDYLRQALAV